MDVSSKVRKKPSAARPVVVESSAPGAHNSPDASLDPSGEPVRLSDEAGVLRLPKCIMIAAAAGLLVIAGGWLTGDAYFADRIMPGVSVDGHAVGGMTRAEARRTLDAATASYRYDLSVGDKTYLATASDLGITYDAAATVTAAYGVRRDFGSLLSGGRIGFVHQVDDARLSAYTAGIAAGIGTAPVDAAVVVSLAGEVSTTDDTDGNSVDAVAMAHAIRASATSPKRYHVKVVPSVQHASLRTADLARTVSSAKELIAVPVALTLDGRTFAPTAAQAGAWVKFERDAAGGNVAMKPVVDEAKVAAYVAGLAKTVDTAAVPKKVNVENGVSRVTQEGQDGRGIDQTPAVAAIVAGLSARTPVSYALTTHLVAFKTISTTLVSLDEKRYLEVNLSKQRLWAWEDGHVVYETPITSGATGAGFATVTGKFAINAKVRDTHLRGYAYGPRYNYDVQVDYWMPFYSGYGFHDASWRTSFGGPDYYYGGSHGCVNLPDAAAAWVFDWASVGTTVWVHN